MCITSRPSPAGRVVHTEGVFALHQDLLCSEATMNIADDQTIAIIRTVDNDQQEVVIKRPNGEVVNKERHRDEVRHGSLVQTKEAAALTRAEYLLRRDEWEQRRKNDYGVYVSASEGGVQ